MSKAKNLFSSLFRYLIGEGKLAYDHDRISRLITSNSPGRWTRFLFGRKFSSYDPKFINGILYYLSLDRQEEYGDIIEELRRRMREEHGGTCSLLLALSQLLHAENQEQIHMILTPTSDTSKYWGNYIGILSTLIGRHEASVGNTYYLSIKEFVPNGFDQYGLFLRRTAEFFLSLDPDCLQRESYELYPGAFCAGILHACQVYDLPIENPDQYFSRALCVSDSRMYYQVTLDICELSLRRKDPQTAYDVLFSWIEQKTCGNIEFFERCHLKEMAWREANHNYVVELQIMMCRLCARLSDSLSVMSRQKSTLRSQAVFYAGRILENEGHRIHVFLRCTAVLLELGEYALVNRITIKLMDSVPEPEKYDMNDNRSFYLSAILSARIGILCQVPEDEQSRKKPCIDNERLGQLRGMAASINRTSNDGRRTNDWKDSIIEICSKIASLAPERSEYISVLLLCIRHLALTIQQELRYVGYRQMPDASKADGSNSKSADAGRKPMAIAYYTTLSNLQYLFEPVYAKDSGSKPMPLKDLKEAVDPKQAKNCLTMMHAHYMNDPTEGMNLTQTLSDWITQKSNSKNLLFQTHAPTAFREQLLDRQFVFLKSFTDIVDQLNMWSMYASDRSSGSDSNGCCVRIAPETFEMMRFPTSVSFGPNHDDLNLYKVAYLRNNEIANKNQPELTYYFELLKKCMQNLNDELARNFVHSGKLLDGVASILQEILTPIVFLFKDASYRAEHELRLIVTRSRTKEDMERISKTPQNPPKLYVNPYHQVFVDQIILGPKVKEPDVWIPHLQYELTEMWEKWPTKNGGKRVPSVRKSSINYRD